jgi:hypothetical protein
MIRSALLLCAGLLAAVCFACAQHGTSSAVPVAGGGPHVQDATCLDGTAFHTHVYWLDNFDPNGVGGPIHAPKASNITPLDPTNDASYIADLDAVFALAPDTFRRDLCGLDGIFLDTTSCSSFASCSGHSWGYRIRDPNNAAAKGRFVAIPKSLWSLGGGFRLYTYPKYENDLLYYTFGWTGDSAYNPTYSAANDDANTFLVTILSALAHETGHIRWYDTVDADRHGQPDYSQVNTGCSGYDFFLGWAGGTARLQGPPHTFKPPKWRSFLTLPARGNSPRLPSHASDPQIEAIDGEIEAGNIRYAAWALDQLYQPNWPWATYFAALSPDEDFVESYKFNVLTRCTFSANGQMTCSNPLLQSLQMQIKNYFSSQPYTENIPADFIAGRKTNLATKAWCVATLPAFH